MLVLVVLALLAGGIVKGALGIGLPLSSMPLLTLAVDLPTAVAILSVPIVVSNLPQALEGGGTAAAVIRLWSVMTALVAGMFLGTWLLVTLDPATASLTVGAALIGTALMLVLQPNARLPPRAEPWIGPPAGLAAGLLGGFSAMFGPPLVVYLVAIGCHGDEFVKYVSVLFLAGSLALLAALGTHGSLGWGELLASSLALVPVFAGLRLGAAIRHRITPRIFRLLVLATVAAAGINLIRRGLG
jgi:uncharacterized membrane protein YfcA